MNSSIPDTPKGSASSRRDRIAPQQNTLEAILDGYINAQLKFLKFLHEQEPPPDASGNPGT